MGCSVEVEKRKTRTASLETNSKKMTEKKKRMDKEQEKAVSQLRKKQENQPAGESNAVRVAMIRRDQEAMRLQGMENNKENSLHVLQQKAQYSVAVAEQRQKQKRDWKEEEERKSKATKTNRTNAMIQYTSHVNRNVMFG